jgi:hypothetical protein
MLQYTKQFVEYATQAVFTDGVILFDKLLLKLKTKKVDKVRSFDEGNELLGVFSR